MLAQRYHLRLASERARETVCDLSDQGRRDHDGHNEHEILVLTDMSDTVLLEHCSPFKFGETIVTIVTCPSLDNLSPRVTTLQKRTNSGTIKAFLR